MKNKANLFLFLLTVLGLCLLGLACKCYGDDFSYPRGVAYDAVDVVNVVVRDSACSPCEVHICQYRCIDNGLTLGRFSGNVGDTVTFIFNEPAKHWSGAAWPDSGMGVIYNAFSPSHDDIRLRGMYPFKFKPINTGVKPKSKIPNHIFGREPLRVDGRIFS